MDNRVSPVMRENELGDTKGCVNEGFQQKEGDARNDVTARGAPSVFLQEEEEDAAEEDDEENGCAAVLWLQHLQESAMKHSHVMWRVVKVLLLVLYLAYTVYSLYRTWGTEGATRLLLLLVIVLYVTLGRPLWRKLHGVLPGIKPHHVLRDDQVRRCLKIGKWIMYGVAVVGAVVYLALQVVPYRPENLVCLAGLAFLLLVGLLMSSKPVRIAWHTVFWGTALQFYLAIFVLRTELGYTMVSWAGDRLTEFVKYTDAGSKFLFGEAYTMHPFVFMMVPVTVFVNSMIAVLYHFGIIQVVIATLGRFLAFCLHTRPVESVNAAANIFFGLSEAPLVVRHFLGHVTDSELFAIITGGFASISLTGVGMFIAFGIPANHLLAASVISAPAALAVAKIMWPESARNNASKVKDVYRTDVGGSKDLLGSVCEAAMIGVTVSVSICANALVFVAGLEFLDKTVEWFGDQAGVDDLSFTKILSYVFYPLMFLCGVEVQDLLTLSRLVGVKVVVNIIVAYQQAGVVIRNSHTLADYIAETNGTWHHVGDDVILTAWNQTLVGGVMTERSSAIVTYILCGFCHLSAFAVALGVMTSLVPERTATIMRQVVRAGVAGNIACFMTGCVAGLLYV